MRLIRENSGVTLVELLVATSMLVIILTAALRPLNAFERTATQNKLQNEAQGRARGTIDRLARELRNVSGQAQFIDRATATDLVFQTVDPLTAPSGTNSINLERVRYCLDSTAQRLWRQTQTWATATPPAVASTATCPDSAWTTQTITAEKVTNGSRAVFTYNNAALTDITLIHTDIYIDVSPTLRPPESLLSDGIYLRNQNKAPIAAFSATPTANRHMVLNGSTSSDPEGGALSYAWFDGSTQIGTGQTCDCVALGTGNRSIKLIVTDQSGITDSITQTVKIK